LLQTHATKKHLHSKIEMWWIYDVPSCNINCKYKLKKQIVEGSWL
jgi:hypothetical protein